MSWRRLKLLIERLPWDSETARSVHGEVASWGPTEHLLAALVDTTRALTWLYSSRHRAKGAAPAPRPEPIVRPGVASSNRRHRTELSETEIARRLVAQQRRR